MQIFALETDIEKLKKRFLSAEEVEVKTVRYHWFPFLLSALKGLLVTLIIIAVAVGADMLSLQLLWTVIIAAAVWIVFVFFPVMRAFIDWRYDCVIITSDKIIIIDQSSVFRQKVTPINLESFANASAETQFLNIFSFGKLNLDLKEGSAGMLSLPFIPDAQGVASTISDTITQFQRRKDLRRYGESEEEGNGEWHKHLPTGA
jgi:hypothetical protein